MSDFNQNQFRQSPQIGQLDLTTNPNPAVFSVRIDPDSTSVVAATPLTPGEGVRLIDGGANDPLTGPPLVDVLAANTGVPFGVKIFDTKESSNIAGDIVQVAGEGAVIWMNAAAALNRGVSVSLDIANPGEVKAVGSDAQFGVTLDKSTAADQLIRVKILARGV